MIKLLLSIAKGLLKTGGMLIIIVALLLAAQWLLVEWQELKAIDAEIAKKHSLRDNLNTDLALLKQQAEAKQQTWQAERERVTALLQNELQDLEKTIDQAEQQIRTEVEKISNLERLAATNRKQLKQVAQQVRVLKKQLRPWDPIFNQKKLVELKIAEGKLQIAQQKSIAADNLHKKFSHSINNSPASRLAEQKKQKASEIADAQTAVGPEERGLLDAMTRKQEDIAAVEELISAQRERVAKDPKQRILAAVMNQLPTALGILALILLLPILIKCLLFFLLAPIAGLLKPIRILKSEEFPAIPAPEPSSVSLPLDIAPGEEILVHSNFLQSSSQPAIKRTQWFLNKRIPFSSIASGMCLLTRIQPQDDQSTHVVVSSQNDPFGEIGLIDIPAGGAMVLHPRSLAGVVKQQDDPVKITRHWRLFSLHAWLTLQLRYLAFHGPCKLILKGCRGVRAEEPDPERPRVINQNATLGFSANLAYKNTRCETFISYLRGKEELFNDQFSGAPGRFVYEEMPGGGKKGGIAGKGLEGMVDAVLKVFGI